MAGDPVPGGASSVMASLRRNSEILDELIQNEETSDHNSDSYGDLDNSASVNTSGKSNFMKLVESKEDLSQNPFHINPPDTNLVVSSGLSASPFLNQGSDSGASPSIDPQVPPLKFVPDRATVFGFDSTSDDVLEDSIFNKNQNDSFNVPMSKHQSENLNFPPTSVSQVSQIKDKQSFFSFEDKEQTFDFQLHRTEEKTALLSDKSNFNDNFRKSPEGDSKIEKSPLLSSLRLQGKSNVNKSRASNFSGTDSEKLPILDLSKPKSEDFSDDDSAPINDSEDTEPIFSQHNLSDGKYFL